MTKTSTDEQPAPVVLDKGAPEPPPERPGKRRSSLHVSRAELVLALPDYLALREVPLKPDPLEALAVAVGDIRQDQRERADVIMDLMPVSQRRVAARRSRLMSAARSRSDNNPIIPGIPQRGSGLSLDRVISLGQEALAEAQGNQGRSGGRVRSSNGFERIARSADLKASMGKFVPGVDAVFELQFLVRTCSIERHRPRLMLEQILAALEAWSGENHLREVGLHLGFTRLRSDSPLYRRHFDLRYASGAFAPKRGNWVTGAEIAGLLKPPTKHNNASNISRSGGVVPPTPHGLPTWDGQPDLLPLGWVGTPGGGERLAGVPLRYLLFALMLGKAGYGKTEMALVQAIALAHNGHGLLFLDPHGDGWQRARPYLAHKELAPRMWEIDLTNTSLDAMVGSWNPLATVNRSEDDLPDIVQYIVTGFASALNWSDSAGRAKAILTRSVESLVELSWLLTRAGRPDLAPTIFQIRTILTDEVWRDTVVPYLPKSLRDFWTKTYPKYSNEATPVVTNIIERLDSSNAIKAFLGSSQSTYDIRHAMDTGKIVFVCPSGTGDTDKIVSCLLIYDVFRAGLSRRDIPVRDRKDFFVWIDELTAVDGAAKGTLAAIAEQLRKFRVKMLGMTQMSQRLTATTRQGLLQNLSILSTTASDIDEALIVTRRWGKKVDPDTITMLQPYHYIMSVTLAEGRTDPFKVRGASVEDLYADYYRPQNEQQLTNVVNENLARRPARDIIADLRKLDTRLRRHLVTMPVPVDDDEEELRWAEDDSDLPPDDFAPDEEEDPGESSGLRVHDEPGQVLSGPEGPDEEPPTGGSRLG